MKIQYLTATLFLASSGAIIGTDAPQNPAPDKTSPKYTIPQEVEQPFMQKVKQELWQNIPFVFGYIQGFAGENIRRSTPDPVAVVLHWPRPEPMSNKSLLASSCLASVLGMRCFRFVTSLVLGKDRADDSLFNMRFDEGYTICGLSVFPLFGIGYVAQRIVGDNPSNSKTAACIAASLVLPALLVKIDEWLEQRKKNRLEIQKKGTEVPNTTAPQVQ